MCLALSILIHCMSIIIGKHEFAHLLLFTQWDYRHCTFLVVGECYFAIHLHSRLRHYLKSHMPGKEH